MYPECLTVKLFQNCQYQARDVAHATSQFTAYNETLRLVPYRPCVNFPSVANFSSVNASPLGIDRCRVLIVAADSYCRFLGIATPAMYREAIVISVAYDVQLDFEPYLGDLSASATAYAWQPMRHFFHPYDLVGSALAAPTTQVLSDQMANQPDVKQVRTTGYAAGNPTPTATGPFVTTMGPVKSQRVRWTGVIWPHKVQEIPFETYLGDKGNYSTGAAGATLPTQYAALQFAGSTVRPDDAVPANANYTGTWTIRLAWSIMLKTPVDDQT